jgi:hypothetical protein
VRGELAGQVAASAATSGNGANAPADNPAHADTLPDRALRRDVPLLPDGLPADETDGETTAKMPESAAAEGPSASRGTPGMSQPESVTAASLHRQTSLYI